MNSTLEYFLTKFNVKDATVSPIRVWYSRYRIIDAFRELDFKIGAEIGTEQGNYASRICKYNPQLKLFCIDPYTVFPYYEGKRKQEQVEAYYESAKEKLQDYDAQILRMTSMEAVKQFEPNSLDFVFIDGNHFFEFVINDLICWSRVVKPGGVVYGHDLNPNSHVEIATKAYMEAFEINPWFIIHAGGKILDCFMYVRQEDDKVHALDDSFKYDRLENRDGK